MTFQRYEIFSKSQLVSVVLYTKPHILYNQARKVSFLEYAVLPLHLSIRQNKKTKTIMKKLIQCHFFGFFPETYLYSNDCENTEYGLVMVVNDVNEC